jgi:hypothetical protein
VTPKFTGASFLAIVTLAACLVINEALDPESKKTVTKLDELGTETNCIGSKAELTSPSDLLHI